MREFSGNILEIRKKDVEVCLYNGATKRKFPDTAKILRPQIPSACKLNKQAPWPGKI